MKIELQFNSVSVQSDQVQDQYPFVISDVNKCLPVKRTRKRRKRKKGKTAGSLIQEIIADIEK